MLLLFVIIESCCICVFFFKQKTAYEMRISDWSSDVCSSDLQEPPVSFAQPFLQADPCAPADLCQTRHIEQLSRGSVGLAGIEDQAPLEADYPCNGFGELADRAVKASADIDVREHGFDMRLPDISRQVHHVNACSGQVVNVEELTHGFATAPDHDVLGIRLHGFMEPSQQRRNYVTVVGMKVVVRTIKIRGHHAAIVAPILAIVAFSQLDTGVL